MNLKNMSKVELHCHLDGSLSPEWMAQVSEITDPAILAEQTSVPVDYSGSLTEYLKKFDLPIACLNTKEHLYEASKAYMNAIAREHVIYTEVRFSPVLLETEALSLRDVTESVIEGLQAGAEQTGIHFGVLLCAMRHHSQEQNMRVLRQAKAYLGAGVCGMDLAGDESHFPLTGFTALFNTAAREGIPFTIHAGECGDPKEIQGAIELGARRIGHGIAMAGRPDLQRLCIEKHIGIELCPISNFQTGAVKKGMPYPAREFLDRGLLATFNTDNRTVSQTSLTGEAQFLLEHCQVTEEELLQMQKNAVECSFAADEVKEELLRQL
jgi:adenosine deaminase